MQTMQRTDDRIHSVSVPSTALVIDDNAELRRLIREKFEFAGFDAYEAKNGVDGLKSTACYSPALITLDVDLADMRPSAGKPGISIGSPSIDVEACVVYIDGDQVELTPAEYRLLGVFADRAGNVVTSHRLLKDLWGPSTNHRNLKCLSILVRDLRERIEPRPHRPRVVREFRSVIVLLNAETPQLPQSTIPCESVNARAKDARLGSKEVVQGVYPLRSS
jgi:DNA-binding response OmpR family regulator